MPRWQGVGGVSGTLAVARSRTRWPLAAARSALPFILATALSGKVCIPPRPARPPRATLAPASRLAVPQRGYGQAAALTPLGRPFFQVAIGTQLLVGRDRESREAGAARARAARLGRQPCRRGLLVRARGVAVAAPQTPALRAACRPARPPPGVGLRVRICSPDHQPRTPSVSSQGLVCV